MTKVIIARGGIGFFSHFFQVLGAIRTCSLDGSEPYVYFNKEFVYWSSNGFNGYKNAWEYYFDNLSIKKHEDLFDISEEEALMAGPTLLSKHCVKDAKTTSHYDRYIGWGGVISKDARLTCSKIISKDIRIRQEIQNLVSSRQEEMLKEHTVGLHFRGTDKKGEIRQLKLDYCPISSYEKIIDEQFSSSKIFVATDSSSTLEYLKGKYKDRLCYLPSKRSFDEKHLHANGTPLLGQEVLVEAILLSKCNHLICGISNVSAAAQCFNYDLPVSCVYENQLPEDIAAFLKSRLCP